ncbi:MAG: CDP-glucose 4,6-dehydratase [Nitrosomonadales bacterium]|nr:MAG: CDP-glucose 4,6-dehydratase [Nitrosomonadales bacterium]
MEIDREFWRDKRVFLTGHTGFKGGWLALWLQAMGAEVHGYSLSPPTDPNIFMIGEVCKGMASSTIADIRDASALVKAMQIARPDIAFHLAAQSLVRYSYTEPMETYAINVMGTVNLFEAIRKSPTVQVVVNVTTDKCYENREWIWPYRENEPMGGYDPYSNSKACSELITSAYRRSFLQEIGVSVASARAGNVIGGGDWAPDRLIPDFLRAIDAGQALVIRSPNAVRPWQHVLEPLSGYLMLAESLFSDGPRFSEAWNFGSSDDDARTVGWIVEYLIASSPGASWQHDTNVQLHEANHLKLDSSKARTQLKWKARWKLQTALEKTLEWHTCWRQGDDMHQRTLEQIMAYQATKLAA